MSLGQDLLQQQRDVVTAGAIHFHERRLSKIRCGCDGAACPETALGDDPLAQKTAILAMAIVDLRTDNDSKRLGIAVPPTCD